MRDIVQNRVLQVLSLFLTEPPTSFHAEAIRDEKLKLLRAIRPFAGEQDIARRAVRGQYARGGRSGHRDDHDLHDKRGPVLPGDLVAFGDYVPHTGDDARWNVWPALQPAVSNAARNEAYPVGPRLRRAHRRRVAIERAR
jgi:hypothetical protein